MNSLSLSQIIQNIKLIEYLTNRKIINITNSDKADNYIHLNEEYKVNLTKQKEEDITKNDIKFKITSLNQEKIN